jgi:prepilin-type N-terminal cleavage/methylation domain-containing protein
MRYERIRGLSLIELLLVIAVIAIVATSSLPSLRGLIDRQQLRGAAQDLHAEFLNARMEAIRRNLPVSLSFRIDDGSGRWCLALSDSGPCDCFEDGACTLAGAPRRMVHSRDFGRVTLATNFSPQDTATFRPVRGTANAGTARLDVDGRRVEIRLSSLGRVRICSNDIAEYPSC